MFSESSTNPDIEEIFKSYQEPLSEKPHFDIVFENYLGLVSQLKQDLYSLRSELVYHKKLHGDITDSLDEFFKIQRLSSIITQNLQYDQIIDNLNEIAHKVIPHESSEGFLLDKGEIVSIVEKPDPDFRLLVENMQEEGILDWLWQQGQPIVVPLSDFTIAEQLKRKTGNLVIAPMIQNQQEIGVYLLHTEKEEAHFNFRDLELLNILTQQAAIAIQYTSLFQELEETHEALKRSQYRLMQTTKLATVGELAGGIAHEINNPLQIILGNIQMAMMGHKTEKSLKIVESQAMRIATIIRGLLSMSRQNNVSHSEYLEINTLIMNTLNLVRGQIEKRNIKIETDLAENLPVVMGSSIYFQQILLNFILHAKKQINRDGTLTLRSQAIEDNRIEIEIQDSGTPMPQEYIDKIMDPFEYIENSMEMNLGLTVSVQMIHDIGGHTQFLSSTESGNRINIQIPIGNNKEEAYADKAASTA